MTDAASRAPPPASPLGTKNYKLVFVGDQGCGKTSIISRFHYDTFDDSYEATIGIDFVSKTLYLDTKPIRLQLWDTAGQERFRCLVPSYIRDSSVALVVYDVTDRKSFDNTAKWVDEVREVRGSQVLLALIGNKIDRADERAVSTEEGEERARTYDAMFMETSAKAGLNVKALFRKVAAALPGVGEEGAAVMGSGTSSAQSATASGGGGNTSDGSNGGARSNAWQTIRLGEDEASANAGSGMCDTC